MRCIIITITTTTTTTTIKITRQIIPKPIRQHCRQPNIRHPYLNGPKCFSNASLVSTLATFANENSRKSGNFENAAFCNN
jgi:hypothetical protein